MQQCAVYSHSPALMLWIKVPVLPVKNEITVDGRGVGGGAVKAPHCLSCLHDHGGPCALRPRGG